MTWVTFYRDFEPQLGRMDPAEAARDYAVKRSSLGHNTRRMKYRDDERKFDIYRVYFSPHPVNLEDAVNVKALPQVKA